MSVQPGCKGPAVCRPAELREALCGRSLRPHSSHCAGARMTRRMQRRRKALLRRRPHAGRGLLVPTSVRRLTATVQASHEAAFSRRQVQPRRVAVVDHAPQAWPSVGAAGLGCLGARLPRGSALSGPFDGGLCAASSVLGGPEPRRSLVSGQKGTKVSTARGPEPAALCVVLPTIPKQGSR